MDFFRGASQQPAMTTELPSQTWTGYNPLSTPAITGAPSQPYLGYDLHGEAWDSFLESRRIAALQSIESERALRVAAQMKHLEQVSRAIRDESGFYDGIFVRVLKTLNDSGILTFLLYMIVLFLTFSLFVTVAGPAAAALARWARARFGRRPPHAAPRRPRTANEEVNILFGLAAPAVEEPTWTENLLELSKVFCEVCSEVCSWILESGAVKAVGTYCRQTLVCMIVGVWNLGLLLCFSAVLFALIPGPSSSPPPTTASRSSFRIPFFSRTPVVEPRTFVVPSWVIAAEENMRRAMDSDFHQSVPSFELDEAVVPPSWWSLNRPFKTTTPELPVIRVPVTMYAWPQVLIATMTETACTDFMTVRACTITDTVTVSVTVSATPTPSPTP